MFVIVAYDVSIARGTKIMKICRKYWNYVQKSVFEETIKETKLSSLQKN